jgi:hypothetical protein
VCEFVNELNVDFSTVMKSVGNRFSISCL